MVCNNACIWLKSVCLECEVYQDRSWVCRFFPSFFSYPFSPRPPQLTFFCHIVVAVSNFQLQDCHLCMDMLQKLTKVIPEYCTLCVGMLKKLTKVIPVYGTLYVGMLQKFTKIIPEVLHSVWVCIRNSQR